MRIYNADYELINSGLSKEPRWVVAIDFSGAGGWHYFTSHADAQLPAGLTSSEYTHSTLKISTLASQTLDPKNAIATVGSLSFDLLDINDSITSLFQTNLDDNGYGLNKKTVKLYKGYSEHTDFATQYELIATQIVSKSVTFDNTTLSYKINCEDAQHLLKKNIFDLASTNITATVEADAATVNVGSTTGFEMFEHDAGYDDAPSATVGYIKLKKSSDEFEIIRYTGKTASSFTGCTRAVFGAKPLKHEYTIGDEADRQIEVEEYVYLEGPVLKIAYAILSGSLYGQAGKTLPSGWHLGIDLSYISTASFTAIGNDVWDTSDPTAGRQCLFQGISKEEGKKFFEKELMLLAVCFHTVQADGQIAIRRMADASPNASTLGTLDASNVISAASLENTLSDIANFYRIHWNWEDLLGGYTRHNNLFDGTSIATHQLGKIKEYSFRGMYGNRMTLDRIYQRFDSLRSMYAGPPLQMTVTTLGVTDKYEVGDTVRVSLENLHDFTNGTQYSLNRAFIIFGKTVNAKNGQVSYRLFGSSQKADAIPAPSIDGLGAVLPDSFYSSGLNAANNIETMALAIDPVNGFAVVGGVGILQVDITCTGVAGDANHTDSIFWYDGDLEIAAGVTVTVVNGAQFRARGYFENKGTITAKGNGIAGVSGYTNTIPPGIPFPGIAPGNAGTPGFVGSTQGAGGLFFESKSAIGLNDVVPPITVEWDGSALVGIPDDLRGTSGGAGGASYDFGASAWVPGGAGGNGGAPIVIICRGFANNLSTGQIDVSGDDGALGTFVPEYAGLSFYSGTGAGGCPGAVLFVVDGAINNVSGISLITANRGATQYQGNPKKGVVDPNPINPIYSYYLGTQAEAMGTSMVMITHVIGEQAPQQDILETTTDDLAPTLAVAPNTPRSIKGDICTIEILANNAGASNYSYSLAYYRVKGETEWTPINNPASPETTVAVTSDGTIYEVITHAVSTVGVESPSGVIAEIQVPNVTSPTLADTAPSELQDLIIPNVSGLELFEQANNTEFTGKDAKFTWRKTSTTEFYEVGAEPTGLGLDAGTLDQYFQDWRVRIYSGSTLLREEAVTDNWYIYTHEKNAEDYYRINNSAGAYRTFTIDVVVRVTYSAEVSPRPARLTVSNPAPSIPTGLSLRATFRMLTLDFNLPTDTDFKGVLVWLGESSGFTRNDATLVTPSTGITNNTLIIDKKPDGTALSAGTTYYVVVQAIDEFGLEGTESVELSATTLKIDGQFDIESQSIKTAQIGLAQITNALVYDMAVDKLTSGSFSGKYINIQSGGNIRSGMTDFNTGIGFWLGDDAGTAKFSIGNPLGNNLAWDGSALTIQNGNNIKLDFSGNYISINNSTFGASGIQLQYNAGSPQLYIGDGANTFMKYQSGVLTVGTLKTSSSGKRIEINTLQNNEIHFYGDRGDATIEQLASIGINSYGSDYAVGLYGTLNSQYVGVFGLSKTKNAVSGVSVDGYGGSFAGGAGSVFINGNAKFGNTTSTPTVPDFGTGMNMYYRLGKLIFQYNDAGTTRYKYLDLTGTGVTWVHSTTAP